MAVFFWSEVRRYPIGAKQDPQDAIPLIAADALMPEWVRSLLAPGGVPVRLGDLICTEKGYEIHTPPEAVVNVPQLLDCGLQFRLGRNGNDFRQAEFSWRTLGRESEEAAPADDFGPRLRLLREARQLTVYALAREAGVDRTYLAHVESGKHVPTLTTLRLLASVLGAREVAGAVFGDIEGDL